jgi:hypothetical protein
MQKIPFHRALNLQFHAVPKNFMLFTSNKTRKAQSS